MDDQKALHIAVIYNPPEVDNPETFFTDKDNQEMAKDVAVSLRKFGYRVQTYGISKKNLYYLKEKKADAFFNVCDGDGIWKRVLRQLEKGSRIFTGSGLAAMQLTVDKVATKKVFEKIDVPTPAWQMFTTGKEPLKPALHFPLIVKPTNEDCSIGITQASVVSTVEVLRQKVQEVCIHYKHGALAEEFITGRELNCTVIGNGEHATVLPLAELQLIDGHTDENYVFDYEAKWVGNTPRCRVQFFSPAPSVPALIARRIEDDAKRAFHALGMKDYARFDIRFNPHTKKWYFLEANANPSIQNAQNEPTVISAQAEGLKYAHFVRSIFEACTKRYVPGAGFKPA